MHPVAILKEHCDKEELFSVLLGHSKLVATKALELVKRLGLTQKEKQFIYESSILHDIGVALLQGRPYIQHGIIGKELLKKAGFPDHALVCERHVGAGISKKQVLKRNIPLPARDMIPQSIPEKAVCIADKFYSKSKPDYEKSIEEIKAEVKKYGLEPYARLKAWLQEFMLEDEKI